MKTTTYPHGTYASVAKTLQCSRQHVRLVALGRVVSERVTRELEKAKQNGKVTRAPRRDAQ